jgi:hypothetical protein
LHSPLSVKSGRGTFGRHKFCSCETVEGDTRCWCQACRAIVALQEGSVNITRDNLQTICRPKFSPDILAMIDFTQNKSLSTVFLPIKVLGKLAARFGQYELRDAA